MQRRRVLAIVALLCELFDFLDEYIELPAEQLGGLDGSAASIESIDRCAQRVREQWGFGQDPIPNVLQLLESKGVLLCPVPGKSTHVGSFALWFRGRPVVGVLPGKQSPVARFEAVHELGHLLLHADVAAGSLQPELDADCFARALLLPADSFRCQAPNTPDLEAYHALARRWGAPVPMVILRAFELGCLPESGYRRALWESKQRSRGDRGRAKDGVTPIVERPVLLRHALSLLAEDWPLAQIAAQLSVRSTDLRMLDSTRGIKG
jgi:Zn-dependent peptidase ImmA (M78 family)